LPRFLLRQPNWVPITFFFSLNSSSSEFKFMLLDSSCARISSCRSSIDCNIGFFDPSDNDTCCLFPRVICHNEYPKIVFPSTLLAVMTLFRCFHACFADSNRFLKVLNCSYYCANPAFLVINCSNPNCLRTILRQ
jgi:hypothetical protein